MKEASSALLLSDTNLEAQSSQITLVPPPDLQQAEDGRTDD